MTTTVFTPEQLSNESYQELPQRSGSFLWKMISHSPAKAMFGDQPKKKVLDFGIWSHAMMLEPERFSQAYSRDFDASVYESLMSKGQDYKDWLKDRGMKVSGTNAELIARILEVGEAVHIEDVEREKYRAELPGREFVPAADFDKIELMRHSLMSDPETASMFEGGFAELSIVSEEFKGRPDLITKAEWISNYKTTMDADLEKFGRKACDMGYPMRAVMECELFKQAYGHYPAGYQILAQEKDAPYLCKPFDIYERSRGDHDKQSSAWQMGRAQLSHAIKLYRKCRDSNSWPGLGKREDLFIPDYMLKRAGLV
jgi:hypothetical protein